MPTKTSRNDSQSTRWDWEITNPPGFGSGPTQTTAHYSNTQTRTDSGPVPGWRSKIAAHQSATSSLDGSKTVRSLRSGWSEFAQSKRAFSPVPFDRSVRVTCGIHFGLPQDVSHLGPGNWNTADNLAKAKFISSCRAAQTKFQSLVSLGEAGETARQLRRPAEAAFRGIVDYVKLLKKTVPQTLRQLSKKPKATRIPSMRKIIANSWLEFCYGWKPLLMDLDNAMQAVADLNYGTLDVVEVSGVGKDEYANVSGTTIDAAAGNNIGYSSVTKTTYMVRYYGQIWARNPNTAVAASHIFGFDPSEWLPSIWELIPYSFVVDYFTNVGNIIDAVSFVTSNLVWVNRTQRVESVFTIQDNGMSPTAYGNFGEDYRRFEPAMAEVRTWSVSRSVYTGGLVPSLEFYAPKSHSLRWANLLALGAAKDSLVNLITHSLGAKRS